MKNFKVLLVLAFVFILSISIMAQDEDEGKWRNFEVVLTGGLSNPMGDLKDWNDSLGAKMGFHTGLSGGYYFTEAFCSGIYFNYTQMGIDDGYNLNFMLYDAGVYVKYALVGETNLEPFIRLSGGMIWSKFPTWVTENQNVLRSQSYDPAFSLAGSLGLLYYTSEYGGLFVELGYHNDLMKNIEADYHGEIYTINHNVNYLEINFGINVFFGSEE